MPANSVCEWLNASADIPAARFVISEIASTRIPSHRLRHRAHAHRVGADRAQHADFGRHLELRAEHPGVDAFVQ